LSKISDILARAARSGGEIITGGKCFDVNEGHFFEPTIVKCDDPENPAVSEEIFGPVLTVQTFDDFEEGLQLADHPSYGLASGVHTQNLDWALRAARSIEAGTVWINNYGLRHVEEPMGGYKKSGFGKDFGPDALRKYTRSKHVRIKIHR
jgi:aldehyde dehydrogenase (NAD+)